MPNRRGDQATGLRRLLGKEQLRVITFAAGSSGVGKTALIAKLAVSMARLGKKVLILDENSRKNVAFSFGLSAHGDLQDVIDGKKTLPEILLNATTNVRVLPVEKSIKRLGNLTSGQEEAFLACISEMECFADIILVDASPDHPLGFSPIGLATNETVIVISKTGASITDAYALIKKVSLGYSHRNFRILVNKVRGAEEARTIYGNLKQVTCSRALANLEFSGYIPKDACFQQVAGLGKATAETPEAPAITACRAIAADMLDWPVYTEGYGRLEKFGQQLLHLSRYIDPVPIYA